MASCKDCIHYDVCKQHVCTYYEFVDVSQQCYLFKDKSKIIELPCKVGDVVYEIHYQRDNYDDTEYPIVSELYFRLSMIEKVGKTVFRTREEAEKALKELNK